MDGVHLKKSCQWDAISKCYSGYADFGCGSSLTDLPLAKEAIVFMVVGLAKFFELPIGYVLIESISAEQLAACIQDAICRLFEQSGVQVRGLVMDGNAVNFSAYRLLGAHLPDRTHFPHPILAHHRVYILPDNCHMFKLVRNHLAERGVLLSVDGNLIKWNLLEQLHELQEAEGVLAGSRLRREHIPEWNKHIMKVKFAVQALSRSTADALQFCHDVTFIKIMDRAFDMNNSCSPAAVGFKATLRPNKLPLSLSFVRQTALMGLHEATGKCKPILGTRKKTCIIGYVSLMRSTIALAHELFEEQPPMHYLLTYRLCQDRIEHLFGNISDLGVA